MNGVNDQIHSPYRTEADDDTAYENNVDLDDCIKKSQKNSFHRYIDPLYTNRFFPLD